MARASLDFSVVKCMLSPYRVGDGMHFGSTAISSYVCACERVREVKNRNQRLAMPRNKTVVLGFQYCAVAYIGRRRFEGRNDSALSNTSKTMQRKKPRLEIMAAFRSSSLLIMSVIRMHMQKGPGRKFAILLCKMKLLLALENLD